MQVCSECFPGHNSFLGLSFPWFISHTQSIFTWVKPTEVIPSHLHTQKLLETTAAGKFMGIFTFTPAPWYKIFIQHLLINIQHLLISLRYLLPSASVTSLAIFVFLPHFLPTLYIWPNTWEKDKPQSLPKFPECCHNLPSTCSYLSPPCVLQHC